jgi:hypothetical protein
MQVANVSLIPCAPVGFPPERAFLVGDHLEPRPTSTGIDSRGPQKVPDAVPRAPVDVLAVALLG